MISTLVQAHASELEEVRRREAKAEEQITYLQREVLSAQETSAEDMTRLNELQREAEDAQEKLELREIEHDMEIQDLKQQIQTLQVPFLPLVLYVPPPPLSSPPTQSLCVARAAGLVSRLSHRRLQMAMTLKEVKGGLENFAAVQATGELELNVVRCAHTQA